MNYLPEIFETNSNVNVCDALPTNLYSNKRWVEFVAHISKFNQFSIPETLEQLQVLLSNESDPVKISALYTGIAKCHIGNGEFLLAASSLSKAYSLLNNSHGDSKAFVLLEMVGFLVIINNHTHAKMILNSITALTNSEYLLRIAGYYEIVNASRENNNDVLLELTESAKYFKNIEGFSTLAYHYKNMGNLHRKNNDFDMAFSAYEKGLEIADKYEYSHIRSAIMHDVGMLNHHRGNFNAAIEILNKVADMADSYYTQSFTYANIGYLYLLRKDVKIAKENFTNALNISADNGVFYLVPGTCYYLGMCHEKLMEINAADQFYNKAYVSGMELIDKNFECRGDIKKAVSAYVPFLQKYNDILTQEKSEKVHELDFTIDKTLNEIRGVFQHAIFQDQLKRHDTIKEASSHLGIAERTFFTAKNRVEKFENEPTPKIVNTFIQINENKGWKALNMEFENNVINFLYDHYGRSKKQLANKLNISYPSILQLTARASGTVTIFGQEEKNEII
ncbi:MAG: tetratricopeptide repeat protein [Pelagibacterales bacterium]|nr:tetratricopeptide repeat protein [Pelagibacterales bacterium]